MTTNDNTNDTAFGTDPEAQLQALKQRVGRLEALDPDAANKALDGEK